MKRYIISRGSVSVAVFTMVGTAKKNMQFGVFVFVEAQEINLRGNLQGSKCDGDCIYYEKVPSPLDSVGFFRNICTPTVGVMSATWHTSL